MQPVVAPRRPCASAPTPRRSSSSTCHARWRRRRGRAGDCAREASALPSARSSATSRSALRPSPTASCRTSFPRLIARRSMTAGSALRFEGPPPREVNTVATTSTRWQVATQGFFPRVGPQACGHRRHRRGEPALRPGSRCAVARRPRDPARDHPCGAEPIASRRPDGKPEAASGRTHAVPRSASAGWRPPRRRQPGQGAACACSGARSRPDHCRRRLAAHAHPRASAGAPRSRPLLLLRRAAACKRLAWRNSQPAVSETRGQRNEKRADDGDRRCAAPLTSGASGAAAPSGDWLGFGRTTDNMRHSPLTRDHEANVDQLGRAYTSTSKQARRRHRAAASSRTRSRSAARST